MNYIILICIFIMFLVLYDYVKDKDNKNITKNISDLQKEINEINERMLDLWTDISCYSSEVKELDETIRKLFLKYKSKRRIK